MQPDTIDHGRDARFREIVDAYAREAEAGRTPDREALLASHPEFAGELAALFAQKDDQTVAQRSRPEPSAPAKPGGRRFGDYEVVREVARGGMGVVYEARHLTLNRTVAIKKIVAGARASEVELRRFQTEAEAVAALDHPNIVPVYEVGWGGNQPYLSMKFMAGGTLADRLETMKDDPRAAVDAIIPVAQAIDHAHRRGVLHRDLKPSNILLDLDGTPHVADFGLARRIDEGGDDTFTGSPLGSPPYMAPEQATGRKDAVSTATDVYGLGAILYALLTGVAPFGGDSVLETIAHVREHAPEPPSRVNPKVDRDLETICLKCLEKDPARRYHSAEALADDLGRWRRGETIAARPVGRGERAWRWCRRRPIQAVAGVLIALLAAASVAGLMAINRAQAERLVEHARVDAHNFWLMHGMIEPFKKMADPDLDADPRVAALRRDVLELAVRAHTGLADSLGESAWDRERKAEILLHVGLLHTMAGDHPRAWDSYRESIRIAEKLAADVPDDVGAWDQVGQAHDHLGMDMWLQGRKADALPHLRAAAEAFDWDGGPGPEGRLFTQHAAWFLLFCPEPSLRNPARALKLARELVEATPDHEARNPLFLGGVRPQFTLALALYRAGDFAGAREAVEKAMAPRSGGDAYDWFLLAMLDARKGDREAARSWFDRAAEWARRNRYGDFELHFLRAEAEEALGPKKGTASSGEAEQAGA